MAKPVILTVDDDASVSRAIARDLRRQYGEHYRIVRAEGGDEALEVLRALTLEGQPTALLLADHRMPGMSGVDFLELATDIVPESKRALLTAYADTDAAIRAINDVDLDRYLLKPWQPPEEQLYPVIDDLLADWKARERPQFEGLRIVGHRWSAESHELRDRLARNGVPYEWLDVDDPDAQQLLVVARVGRDRLPVVVVPGGEVLIAPDITALAARLGLSTTARLAAYDLVVVGAGPAGLGAAVYGASEGLRTLLVEQTAAGGQAGTSSRIENYLGFPEGISGDQLARRARDQAMRLSAELVTLNAVTALHSDGALHTLTLADGAEIAAHAVVIATGAQYRRLPTPGAAALEGRGVFYGAAAHEATATQGEDVFVVGSANSAGQAAMNFAGHARHVTILCRNADGLATGMSQYLIDQIEAQPSIAVRTCAEVVECHGSDRLERLVLADSATGERSEVPAQWLFVFIGAAPEVSWLPDTVVRDDHGFVRTGPDLDGAWSLAREPYFLETSVPGVFAAGDVRLGSVKRVASAVGEGAMAVTLVHRYLGGR